MSASTRTPVELLYRQPAPFEFVAGDLADAIEMACDAQVTDVTVDNAGHAVMRIRPPTGHMGSTENALREFAALPGPVVCEVARTPDHLWLRARLR